MISMVSMKTVIEVTGQTEDRHETDMKSQTSNSVIYPYN